MLEYLRNLADPMPLTSVYAAVTIACMLASYLICGIPFGKILGRAMGHVDIQKAGSGNIGTTNALRVAGPKVAALTLLFDVLKGVLCVNAARLLIGASQGYDIAHTFEMVPEQGIGAMGLALVCLSCLLGHIFTPYLHFHGGKGIATGVGVLFGLAWPLALIHLAIFIVLVAITKYVSAGSIVTATLVCVTVPLYFPQAGLQFHIILGAMGLLVVWAHRKNIKKLLHGHESKLSFTKRVTKMDDAE